MTQKKDKKEQLKAVEKISQELLLLMGTKAKPEVVEDKDSDTILINIITEEEAGLLIGSRGDTLNSLQTIIGMIFYKKFGEWKRIIVNISDWRERQEERMRDLANQTAQRAIETGDSQSLYNLNASQRRIIHMALSENKDVETESEGEGRERYLIVKPSNK